MGATLNDLKNSEYAQAEAERIEQKRRERQAEAAKYEETIEHIESGEQTDRVKIVVRGQDMLCEPLGVGERLRPLRKVKRAEERGDDMAAARAVLDMIDSLIRVSPDGYGQPFWDSLGDEELRDTYRDLSEKSGGGNG